LLLESFAYSALLGGEAFRDWLLKRAPRPMPSPGTRVRCTRESGILTITLAHRRAATRSTRTCAMNWLNTWRPLAMIPRCRPCTCAPMARLQRRRRPRGIWQLDDLVLAHAIRTLRSPARLMNSLAGRTTAFLHGACVGAGIEIPAAAGRVIAAPDARFWLPSWGWV